MKTVTQAQARPHLLGRRIDLSWLNPPAADFAGGPALARIHIVRRERPRLGRAVAQGENRSGHEESGPRASGTARPRAGPM